MNKVSTATLQRKTDWPLMPWAVLCVIGLAWGAAAPLASFAVAHGYHPFVAGFWNIVVATTTISVVCLFARPQFVLSPHSLIFFFVCGLLGRALPISVAYLAFSEVPVGLVVMLMSSAPMLTLAISASVGVDRLDGRRVIGLASGALAVSIVVMPGSIADGVDQRAYLMLPIIIALSYALEGAIIKRYKPSEMSVLGAVLGTTWAALILLVPLVSFYDPLSSVTGSGFAALAIAGGALLHLGGYFAFVWLTERAGPVFSSQVGYLVTATGIASGIVFFGERHTASIWFAVVFLFIGLVFVRPVGERPQESLRRWLLQSGPWARARHRAK